MKINELLSFAQDPASSWNAQGSVSLLHFNTKTVAAFFPECSSIPGAAMSGDYGAVLLPGFPLFPYAEAQHCRWYLTVEKGHRIRISFEQQFFDVSTTSKSALDQGAVS